MKTKILTLMIVFLLAGINTQADEKDSTKSTKFCEQEGFRACINKYPADIIEFRVQKTDEDVVWVKILDEKGSTLYKKRYKRHNAIELDCNIKKLPAGSYNYVVMRNGDVVLKKTIRKTTVHAG